MACQDDAPCRLFGYCLARCAPDDLACGVRCRSEHPKVDGVLASAATSCIAKSCERACESVCGGYVSKSPTCTACARKSCCAESTACSTDKDCAALMACERACSAVDGSCLGACERRYPLAVTAARTFGACLDKGCSKDCLPADFRCLQDPLPDLPPTGQTFVDVGIRAIAFIDGTPWAGIDVRACRERDQACASPWASGKTDAQGYVKFRIPEPTYNGYFEFQGAGIVPSLYFWGEVRRDLAPWINVINQDVLDLLTLNITPPKPGFGHFIITALNCRGITAPGVSYELSPRNEAVGAYLSMGLPSKDAPYTDGSGFGGFINVTANTGIKVSATVQPFGTQYPGITAFTRPGWVAYVQVLPPVR